jgi:hypothetical protein
MLFVLLMCSFDHDRIRLVDLVYVLNVDLFAVHDPNRLIPLFLIVSVLSNYDRNCLTSLSYLFD